MTNTGTKHAHDALASGHSELAVGGARRRQTSRTAGSPFLDAALGVLLGLLATANLVQGAWLAALPLLNLTNVAFVLLLPVIVVASARAEVARPNWHFLVLLSVAVALGFHAAGLNPSAAAKRLQIVPGVLFPLLAGYLLLTSRARVRAFAATIVAQACVVAAALLAVPDDAYAPDSGRLSPTGSNPISSGRLLAGGALVLLCFSLEQGRTRAGRLALILSVPLMLGAAATGSRGPLAALLVALIVLVVRLEGVSNSGKMGVLCACGALVGVVAQALVKDGSRLTDISDTARRGLLVESVRIASEHPWGIGWGNLYDDLPAWAVLTPQGYRQYPHNVLVEFVVESGWLGGLFFVLFAYGVLHRCWMLAAVSGVRTVAALTVFAFGNALVSSDVIGNRLLWVVAGATLARSSSPLRRTRDRRSMLDVRRHRLDDRRVGPGTAPVVMKR